MTNKPMIAVWFSCGAASAVALMKTLEQYGESHIVRAVYNPVKEEDEDNMRFLCDVEKWLGISIEIAVNPKYPSCRATDVWAYRRFMSGPAGAPCTQELKKRAREAWEDANKPDFHVLGFTSEETQRQERFMLGERSNTIPVLIDNALNKQDCYRIIQAAGLELPRIYKMGYPNANCIGCVKATSPTYWNHVRKKHPKQFEERAVQSRDIGARLVRVKGKRIFLDELNPNAKGHPMKDTVIDCGIFCEEL